MGVTSNRGPALTNPASPHRDAHIADDAHVAGGAQVNLRRERTVLERIYSRCAKSIGEVCALSSLPSEFLAALTANESAGAAGAARFEPAVYRRLQAVASGQAPAYGRIRAWDIDGEVDEMLVLSTDERLLDQDRKMPDAPSKAAGFHAGI